MFSNSHELTAAGFLAAAAQEMRRLGGLVSTIKIAKAAGNAGALRHALLLANERADRIETLLNLAAESQDSAQRDNA